ncbi:MAG: DUF6273 domain-containing protein [Oscillospiraceae bacterium]|nr:DUF6273 domain-containing protein [Oscillospiraceae bacterium]
MKKYNFILFALILVILIFTSCQNSPKYEGNNSSASSESKPENSKQIFDFINTDETKRLIADIKTISVTYLQITYTDKITFRTAITDQTQIMEVFNALNDIWVLDMSKITPKGPSYTFKFRLENGFLYKYTFYDGILELNGEFYNLYNSEKLYDKGVKLIEADLPDTNPLYKPGNYVYFGVYEQDSNVNNGKEKIKWRVLDIKDGKMFLLTDVCIERKIFHSVEGQGVWENSDIRKWLNKEFMDIAFTQDEKAAVVQTTVKNSRSSDFGYAHMNDTLDNIFLLDEKEVYRYFDDNMDNDGIYLDRKAGYTETIRKDLNKWGTYEFDYINWWLRTLGNSKGEILDNLLHGVLDADIWRNGIRPAMWVYISEIK